MSKHSIIFTLERDGKRFITAAKYTNAPIAHYGIKYMINKFWWMDVKVYKTKTWRIIPIYLLARLGYYKIL